MRPALPVPLASLSAKALSSFFALGSVGIAVGRTVLLAPALWGRERPESRRVAFGALGGCIGAMALLVALLGAGVDQLPEWAKVPPAVVSVQLLHGLVMAAVVPDSYEPSIDLNSGDLAYTLYGMIAFPPTALFVAVMTAASILS